MGNGIASAWYNPNGTSLDRRATVISQVIIVSIRQEMSAMFLFIVMEVKHVIPPQMHKWLVLLMSSKCSFVSNLNGIESNFLSLHAVATAL